MAETKKRTTKKAAAPKKEVVKENLTTAEESSVVETAPAPAPVQMIVEQKAPPIRILYIDSAIPNNEVKIGPGRSIFGSGKIFAVQPEQFEGEFMTATIIEFIRLRKLIILSGLTDEQRRQYNCYYEEGEVLKSEGMFDFFFELPVDEAAEKYEALCPEHKRLVARRFIDAYFGERKDNRISRSRAEALNAVSKSVDPEGLFTPIVKDINEKI